MRWFLAAIFGLLAASSAYAFGPENFITGAVFHDCSIALTTGGTAQNIVVSNPGIHGIILANIDSTSGSGEPVWFSLTGTAAASTLGSYPMAAPTATTFAGLNTFFFPYGFNGAISVIAATTGHKISCTWF